MNTHRSQIIKQTLANLPSGRLICLAARAAHFQQGPCPPVWRPFKLHQHHRRQQALGWLLDAVARSLQGHMFVSSYLQTQILLTQPSNLQATLLHVRTAYLQDLLNYTEEDNPTLKFEDYLPT